uniref:Uncharacterized protein n=1 Tax=Zea mays TaxID=4577 RepID=A0A804N939_MAIZE
MALLAVQGMAMSTAAAALPSHNHGAVSSYVSTSSYALAASAAFPRARAAFAVGAVLSATVTPVLDDSFKLYLVLLSLLRERGQENEKGQKVQPFIWQCEAAQQEEGNWACAALCPSCSSKEGSVR